MNRSLKVAGGASRSRLFGDVVRAIGLIVDFDGGVSVSHQWRTGLFARRIAEYLPGVSADQVFYGGLLHDIGSVGLPVHVVRAARSGFRDARSRAHPAVGARILEAFSMFRGFAPMVADHHERYDGRGFPRGKRGSQIPIEASILALADLLDVRLSVVSAPARAVEWNDLCDAAAGTLVSAEVAEAARRVLAEDDGRLFDCFDATRVADEVEAAVGDVRPPEDAGADATTTLLPEALWLLARLMDMRHPGTMAHSTRVAFLAYHIARAVEPTMNMWDILWAGLLHDVGTVGIPRQELDAGAPHRTVDEDDRRHTELTLHILSTIRDLSHLALPAASHHEVSSGDGPLGLSDDEIPLLGRIIGIADHYDVLTALSTPRASHEVAIHEIRRGLESVDGHLVEAAAAVLDEFGARVQEIPESMGGLYRFFDVDVADAGSLLPQGAFVSRASQSVSGVLLYEIEPWAAVVLDASFNIRSGGEAIAELAGMPDASNLAGYLSEEDRLELLPQLGLMRLGRPSSQYLFTPRGRPLEAVFIRRDTGFDLFVRSAANRLQTLDRMAHFYRNFLSSTEAAYFTDDRGHIVDVNRTLLTMYGLKLREVVGRSPAVVLGASGLPDGGAMEEEGGGSPSWSGYVVTTHSDGTEIPVYLSVTQVRDANGSPLGTIGHAVDLTEQQQLRDQLEEKNAELAAKNAELERLYRKNKELMAITSHDLKAPLSAMIAYAELLADPNTSLQGRERDAFLRRISSSGHKLVAFINAMLDIEKIDAGTFDIERAPGRVDLIVAAVVEDLWAHASARGVELHLQSGGEGRQCMCDRRRMEQVLNNLVGNAIKFSPRESRVRVTYRETRDHVIVRVEDEGRGVPEAELETIFDRFHQARGRERSGAGLGLTIARHIVESHGGRVWANNRTEGGAVFQFEIPVLVTASDERTRAEVVVIEERAGSIGDLPERLRQRGIRVISISSARELALVATTETPRLVLANETELSPAASTVLADWRVRARAPRFVHVGDRVETPCTPFDDMLSPPLLDSELSGLLRAAGLGRLAQGRVA